VGRLLVRASAGNLKKVSLELGGKSPNIVFADADLEAAPKSVFMGIFFCQGEICSAGSRLFVERGIYDEFVERLANMARSVKLGHGLDAIVAIKWVIVEPDSNKATRVREDYRNAIYDLIAPESFAIKCAYSLTKKQRQRLLPDARALWDDIMLDAPAFTQILPLVDRAFDVTSALRSAERAQAEG
jgi:Aldehyde dehydrogenase family